MELSLFINGDSGLLVFRATLNRQQLVPIKLLLSTCGNRAFLTGYDGENVLEIGKGDLGRINRFCSHLDNLLSRAALSKNKRQRYLMRKAATRMRTRIQHLVKDLHNKVASVLTNGYKLIFLPTYETSQMVLKSQRKINRKSVRNMLTWSHGKFASPERTDGSSEKSFSCSLQ
jgi:transposase